MELNVVIKANIESLKQGFNKAVEATKSFGAKISSGMDRVGGQIQAGFEGASKGALDLAKNLAIPAGVVTMIGKSLLDSTAEFESGMRRAAALSVSEGETVEQVYDEMRKAAIQMGKDSVYSAAEIAGAMGDLGAAGFETKKVIESMPGVLSAAAASGEGLEVVVGLMTSAISVFGDEAGGASHIADVLAMAANKSKASVGDMTYAFQYAAPQAKMFGVSLEELSAMTALLSDRGMQASNIGTGLKSVFINLTDLSKDAARTLDELGVSTLDAQNNFRPMPDLIRDLSKAMEHKTSTEKAMIATQLVGKVASGTLLGLMDAGHEKLIELTTALKESDGASKEAADNMLKGWSGALKKLASTWDVLQQDLMTSLGALVETIANTVSGAMDAFLSLPEPIKETIVTVGALVGAILVIAPIVATVVGTVLGAMATLNAPFIALAALVALFGFNLGGIGKATEGIQERFSALMEVLSPIFEKIMENVAGLHTTLQPMFDALADGLFRGIEAGLPMMAEFINLVVSLADLIMAVLSPIIADLTVIFTEAIEMIAPLFTWLFEKLSMVLEFMTPSLKKLGEGFGHILRAIWDVIKVIVDVLRPAIEVLGVVCHALVAALAVGVNVVAEVFAALEHAVGATIDFIVDKLRFVMDLAKGVWDFIGGFFGGGGDVEVSANVGHNARGTNNWRGGLTWVNEEGGELINLPQGTQIIPHDVSMRYAETAAKQHSSLPETKSSSQYYVELKNVNIYDQRDIETLSREIAYELDKRMA